MFGSLGNQHFHFNAPWGLAIDKEGRVVIADQQNHRISIFTGDGKFLMKLGGFGKQDGKMAWPATPVLDQEGRILVPDNQNNRIQVFQGF